MELLQGHAKNHSSNEFVVKIGKNSIKLSPGFSEFPKNGSSAAVGIFERNIKAHMFRPASAFTLRK
jgi:hypothetical protein